MKKLLAIGFVLFFLTGCSSFETDNKERISGIVDACKNNTELMLTYLEQKVEQEEISQIVGYTIYECLKPAEGVIVK